MRVPPSTWPKEAPPAPTKLNAPNALARSAGSGKSAAIMPRLTEATIAPPAPWTKRAATSVAGVAARPQATEAAVKTASPAVNIFLRPIRSPIRPARSSRPPNAIM